jgi:DNA polymerase III sliding clamp (beta) subunit (PCNA family)
VILVQADSDKRILRLTCTNLTVTMQMILKDVDVSVGGETVIPAMLFVNMLGLMDSENAELFVDGNVLRFKCGLSTVSLPTCSAEKYPKVKIKIPKIMTKVSGLTILAKKPVSIADERSHIDMHKGVQMNLSSGNSTACATDGKRFMIVHCMNVADSELNLFIPESSLNVLCGIVKPNDELYVGVSNNTAIFVSPGFMFSTMLLNGDLSGIEKRISEFASEYKATVDSKEFTQTLSMCMTLASFSKSPCVEMAVTEDSLTISSESGESSVDDDITANDTIPMQDKVFYYNPKYLHEFAVSCVGELQLLFTQSGVLKMKCGLMEYVVSAQIPVVKSEPTQDSKPSETKQTKAPKTKFATKGKTAKSPESEAA